MVKLAEAARGRNWLRVLAEIGRERPRAFRVYGVWSAGGVDERIERFGSRESWLGRIEVFEASGIAELDARTNEVGRGGSGKKRGGAEHKNIDSARNFEGPNAT